MSITDELREWAKEHLSRNSILAIADRIDAEHERQCAESWMRGHDAWAAIDRSDEMAEHGWIRLPKDADGEVWHVGDFVVGEVNPRNPKAIERMLWYGPDSGWQLETDTIIYPCPDRPRHHHEPTVEDVLREFALAVCKDDALTIRKDVVDEYAAKLQLREDA